MNTQEIKDVYDRYVIPNYTRNPILLTKGNGVDVWDAEGKRYLDLFSGWAVSLLGHCHPNVVAAIQKQAALLQHAPNIYYTEPQGLLAKHISERSFGGQSFFAIAARRLTRRLLSWRVSTTRRPEDSK